MKKNYIKRNGHTDLEAYSQLFDKEVTKKTFIAPLIGKDANSIIQLKEVTNQGRKHDKIVFNLRGYTFGTPVFNISEQLEGNEGQVYALNDYVAINEIFCTMRVMGNRVVTNHQSSIHELRKEAKYGLVNWHANYLSAMFFLSVCGYTAHDIGNYPTVEEYSDEGATYFIGSASSEITRPTDKRIIRANGKMADEELDENDTFTLELLDKAILRAKRETPRMKPVCVDGENFYVLYLHPIQLDQLRANIGREQWREITKALHYKKIETKSPLLNGAVGIYNGVILHETEWVTPGVQYNEVNEGEDNRYNRDKYVPNVRRGVLLGAQSAIMAIRKDRGATHYRFMEKRFGYDNDLGVAAVIAMGMKKTRFNVLSHTHYVSSLLQKISQQDFGVIVLPTYAA
ncbi:phage capsid family protein [Bartonella sp. CB74]|uniref:phage capsid family protein n=1 Tax=Bartonella sp. CB74 TaxID=3113620 RepID=UPI002F96E087